MTDPNFWPIRPLTNDCADCQIGQGRNCKCLAAFQSTRRPPMDRFGFLIAVALSLAFWTGVAALVSRAFAS